MSMSAMIFSAIGGLMLAITSFTLGCAWISYKTNQDDQNGEWDE